MNKVVVAFLFCLTSSIANAQAFEAHKPLLCDETKKIIESLNTNWKEIPIWTAKDGRDESRYGLFVNDKTKTWTLIQLTPQYACILGVGEESKLILPSL